MGLFSGLSGKGGGFNWENALLGLIGGPQVATQLRGRRRAEAEAEQAREAAATRAEAAAALGVSKEQINAMRPEEISRMLQSRFETRQFGSEGGSVMSVGPQGQTSFQNAPRSYSDEGRLFQIDPQGNPTQVLDARENDIDWQTGQWGAFATDRSGRPVAPGTNIQSPMGGQRPLAQQPQPGTEAMIPPHATPTSSGDYPSRVGAVLAQAGLPQHVVAGILGNGHHESGGRWNEAVGDGGSALGAFQWRNERAENFQRITGAHPNQATPEQTAQFVLWELQNPQAAGMTPQQVQAIISAPTPDAAARLFSQHYERPNARLAHDDRRAALASQYAGGAQFAQASMPGTPGQGRSVQDQAATGMVTAPQQAPPGYQWSPGGLAPIPGGPGDQTYQRDREQRQDANQVIQQYRADPEVRRWEGVRTSTMQIRQLGASGNPADDVALIFSFMRAMDPNSTVRESEFSTAQNTAGVPDRVRNYYNQAQTGQLLSPNQRRDMIRTAERLYRTQVETYNRRAQQYRAQLVRSGMSPQQAAQMVPIARGTEQQFQREVGRRQQQRRIRIISRRPAG